MRTVEEQKQVLFETVQRFGKQEWFRDAVYHNQHPNSGEPTLEIKVNYIPMFERKTVKEFALQFGLTEIFTVID